MVLRDALESFRHDEAMERVRRWRGAADADSEADVAGRHEWLGRAGRVRAMLDDAVRDGRLDDEGHAALRAHLARAAADIVLAGARDRLEATAIAPLRAGRSASSIDSVLDTLGHEDADLRGGAASALSALVEQVGAALVTARRDADEAGLAVFAGGAAPPDSGPSAGDLRESAEALLSATDDVADEVRRWLIGSRRAFTDLLVALRFDEVGDHAPRRDRFRRLAEGLRGLGFERDLSARVRIAGVHPFPTPRARLVLLRVPGDVRVFESAVERGITSEIAAAETLGRALAHTLAAPALPVEHRRPLAGSVARGVGAVFAQLLADRVYLGQRRKLAVAPADRVGRAAGAALVLLTRARAAALLGRTTGGSPETVAEAGATHLERALGVPLPIEYARLAAVTPAAIGPRYRGAVTGLAIAWQLRERFDEDWFANPKAAEPIRAAAARGGRLAVERFADEIGVDADTHHDFAAKRLAELFG